MQIFVRVAEAGSFIAVADQLRVDRSVVTRQVAALEKRLGTKLMTRSTRRLSLTVAGAEYLENCRVILNLVDAAESGLAAEASVPRGRIRVGLPQTYGVKVLMPALLDFARCYPDIELMMDFSDERSNLIEEGLDLSIRITADLQPGDIVRKISQCRLLTLASPDYIARFGKPTHPTDLQHHECLVYTHTGLNSHWVFRDRDGAMQVPVRGRLVGNSGEALMVAAVQGMGITHQPDFIAKPFLEKGLVREILRKFSGATLGVYAVLPSNRYIPHRVNVLIAHLAAWPLHASH